MNLKSLYVKILLSFAGVFLIAGILIVALFVVTAGRQFKDHLNRQSMAKLSMLRTLVQEKADRSPELALEHNSDITEMLDAFSNLFDLDIWLEDPNGLVVFKTASAVAFPERQKLRQPGVFKDGIRLYHLSRRHFAFYATIPVDQDQKVFTLHILLEKNPAKKPEAFFLFGLLIIGLVVAILMVPLSRIITRRLKTLNQTALAFAEGDLSGRITVCGKDEIAHLSKTFNFMADRLEKMISDNQELTANISHELRSPLTRIRVSVELIQEKLKTMEVRDIYRYMEHIDQDIDVLDDLIDKILKLSRINLHSSQESIQPVDLNRVIADLKKKYVPSLDQKNLRLTTEIEENLVVQADKTMVESIFLNLLDNAIKYTPENGSIRIRAFLSERNRVCMQIANPCRRLEDKELERIFDPFFRLKENTCPGSGLGLTIVKKQVAQCKGRIFAENKTDGLCFTIEFQG